MKNDLEKQKDQDSSPSNGLVQKQFMEMKRIILSSQQSVENVQMSLQNVETKGSVDLLSHFTKVKCDSWT